MLRHRHETLQEQALREARAAGGIGGPAPVAGPSMRSRSNRVQAGTALLVVGGVWLLLGGAFTLWGVWDYNQTELRTVMVTDVVGIPTVAEEGLDCEFTALAGEPAGRWEGDCPPGAVVGEPAEMFINPDGMVWDSPGSMAAMIAVSGAVTVLGALVLFGLGWFLRRTPPRGAGSRSAAAPGRRAGGRGLAAQHRDPDDRPASASGRVGMWIRPITLVQIGLVLVGCVVLGIGLGKAGEGWDQAEAEVRSVACPATVVGVDRIEPGLLSTLLDQSSDGAPPTWKVWVEATCAPEPRPLLTEETGISDEPPARVGDRVHAGEYGGSWYVMELMESGNQLPDTDGDWLAIAGVSFFLLVALIALYRAVSKSTR